MAEILSNGNVGESPVRDRGPSSSGDRPEKLKRGTVPEGQESEGRRTLRAAARRAKEVCTAGLPYCSGTPHLLQNFGLIAFPR